MCVLIPLAISQFLHEPRGRITDVKGNRFGGMIPREVQRFTPRLIHAVRFRRSREVHRRLGQCQLPFGGAERVIGITRGNRDCERLGIGESYVLVRRAMYIGSSPASIMRASQ